MKTGLHWTSLAAVTTLIRMSLAERLGKLIERRRLDLGLSVNRAATFVPVSRQTWAAIEAGTQQLSAHRFAGFERALAWAAGSIEAVLAGGEPVELTDRPAPPVDVAAAVDVTEPTLAAEIERIRGLPIPPGEKRAAVRALIDLWADVEQPAGEDTAAG